MPRYYFHVVNGDGRTPDEEGMDHASDAEARAHAILGIRSILSEEAKNGQLDLTGRIEVTDGDGVIQFEVPYRMALQVTGIA